LSIIGTLEKRMALGPMDDSWYYPGGFLYGGGVGGPKTKAGSAVSELNAMKLSIVWCCIKILSEDTASLPLHLYRRLEGGGKERATEHPLYGFLHNEPNPEMTAMSFRETFASHLLSWGNAYAEKEFGRGMVGRDRIVALWPIAPNRVTVFRDDKKQIKYRITIPKGFGPVELPKRQILHAPGLSFDGLVGYSPIAAAREAIGLGMALEEFGALYFGNGTHPSAVVTHEHVLKDPKAMREALVEVYGGLGNAHRLMLLEDGMDIKNIGIPPEDSQFIETRRLQNIDIGTRVYRLPPQMYGEYDKASTYASAEQFAIDYVTKTLRSWLVRLEQSYNMNLLSPEERGEYFFEHLVDGLLRGDIKSRYEAYAVGRNNGWLNADEIRELENMNPTEDGQGKIYLIPLNMMPATDAGKEKEPSQQESLENKAIYRTRLESAYQRIFIDAANRVLRKETKRLRWGMEKHAENGDFNAFIDEFYQEMPEYIKNQLLPAFMSLADAILGMELELNDLKLNGNKASFERFVSDQVAIYAENHINLSRLELSESLRMGAFKEKMDTWETERAGEIASNQTIRLADKVIDYLKTITGEHLV